LRPDRLRHLERPFGWAPFRLLSSGQLARLSVSATALYLVLCLVADRQGLSYWGEARLQALVGLDAVALRRARDELQRHDLLAFDGKLYQLLSLPPGDCPTTPPAEKSRREPGRPEPIGSLLASLREKWEGS
jgi:hypothetical protein